jgi:protein-disulfide isomerase
VSEDPFSQPGPDRAVLSFTIRRSHLWGVGGLLIGFGAGVLVASRGTVASASGQTALLAVAAAPAAEAAQPTPAAQRIVHVETDGRPARGPADAPVVIVEFTDYGCPFCRRHVDSTLTPLLEANAGRVRYVVRNYPIPSLHPQSILAAQAAECAHDQGHFWAYHDALFRAASHDPTTLKRIAAELGLDARRFGRCLDRGEKAALVERDMRDGAAAGVTGTPTFFVNGRTIEGFVPVAAFNTLIDQILR